MKIIDFNKAKRKYVAHDVYLNDVVEWKDYNGEVFEGRIQRITFLDQSISTDGFPLWDKDEMLVFFDDGLSVCGTNIIRKLTGVITRDLNTLYTTSPDYKAGYFQS